MNEWGLPDWRNEKAYYSKWSFAAWRWQFIRRRPSYRMLYAEESCAAYERHINRRKYLKELFDAGHIVENTDQDVRIFDPDRPDEDALDSAAGDEQGVYVFDPERKDEWLPYSFEDSFAHPDDINFLCDYDGASSLGLGFLINPRNAAPPDDILQAGRSEALAFYFEGEPVPYADKYQMAVAINLLQPIGDQLKQISKMANKRKSKISVQEMRQRKDKYLLYLRALDAKEDGARLSEIGGLLPLTMGNRSQQAAMNLLYQAEDLRDNI